MRCCTRRSTRKRRLRGDRHRRGSFPGRSQGRDRAQCRRCRARRRGRTQGDPRALVHRGRRRCGLLRLAGHPHERGRQGEPRGAGRARHGSARGDRRGRCPGRHPARRGPCQRPRPARRRSHRDRRQPRQDHAGGRPLVQPQVSEEFQTVLSWCDELRTLGVRANADTPADASKAISSAPKGSDCAAPSTCSSASASR